MVFFFSLFRFRFGYFFVVLLSYKVDFIRKFWSCVPCVVGIDCLFVFWKVLVFIPSIVGNVWNLRRERQPFFLSVGSRC